MLSPYNVQPPGGRQSSPNRHAIPVVFRALGILRILYAAEADGINTRRCIGGWLLVRIGDYVTNVTVLRRSYGDVVG
jgi:hypothetical protein